MNIQTIADLRQLYAAPQGRAVQKEIQPPSTSIAAVSLRCRRS